MRPLARSFRARLQGRQAAAAAASAWQYQGSFGGVPDLTVGSLECQKTQAALAWPLRARRNVFNYSEQTWKAVYPLQNLMARGMEELLRLAGSEGLSEPWPRVHALNVLRAVYNDAGLATDSSPYYARGARACLGASFERGERAVVL